jgi:hypothetical protein
MDKAEFFALPLTKLIDLAISHIHPELNKMYEIILNATFDINDVEDPAAMLIDILTEGKKSAKPGQTIKSLFMTMQTGQAASSAPISFNRSMVTVTGGQRGGVFTRTDAISTACLCILIVFYCYSVNYAARALPENILGYGVALIALDIAQAYLRNGNPFVRHMLMPFTILDQYFKPKRHIYLIKTPPSGNDGDGDYFVGTLEFDKFTDELLSFNEYGYLFYYPLQPYGEWQGLGDRPSLKDVLRAKGYDVDNLLVIPINSSTRSQLRRYHLEGIKKADFDYLLQREYTTDQIVPDMPTLNDDIIAAEDSKYYIEQTLRNAITLAAPDPIKVQLRDKLASITVVHQRLLRLKIGKITQPDQDYAGEIGYYESIRGPGQLLDQFNYYKKVMSKKRRLRIYLEWYRIPAPNKLSQLELFILQQPNENIYAARGLIAATFELFDKFHEVYRSAQSRELPDITAQILVQENAIEFSNYSIANAATINAALDEIRDQLNQPVAGYIPQGRIAATAAGRANLTALHAAASAALAPEPVEFAGQELTDPISQNDIEINELYAYRPGIVGQRPAVFAFSWDYFQNPASNDSLFHIVNGSVVSPPPNHFMPIKVNGQIRLIMVGGDTFLEPSEFRWARHTGGVQNLIAAILPKSAPRSEVELLANGSGSMPAAALRRPGSARRRGSNAGAAAGAGGGSAGLLGGRRKTHRRRFASKRKVRKSRRGYKQN